jgi:hypothetical protein
MFDARSVSRALLLTTVVAVAAAPAASAREADAPVHQSPAAVAAAPLTDVQSPVGEWGGANVYVPPGGAGIVKQSPRTANVYVPPRVEGIGHPPIDRGVRATAPTAQAPSHGGFDWTLAAVVVTALLSVMLLGVAGWKTRSRRAEA